MNSILIQALHTLSRRATPKTSIGWMVMTKAGIVVVCIAIIIIVVFFFGTIINYFFSKQPITTFSVSMSTIRFHQKGDFDGEQRQCPIRSFWELLEVPWDSLPVFGVEFCGNRWRLDVTSPSPSHVWTSQALWTRNKDELLGKGGEYELLENSRVLEDDSFRAASEYESHSLQYAEVPRLRRRASPFAASWYVSYISLREEISSI
jgi:hypothetical protein